MINILSTIVALLILLAILLKYKNSDLLIDIMFYIVIVFISLAETVNSYGTGQLSTFSLILLLITFISVNLIKLKRRA